MLYHKKLIRNYLCSFYEFVVPMDTIAKLKCYSIIVPTFIGMYQLVISKSPKV